VIILISKIIKYVIIMISKIIMIIRQD